MNMDHPPKPVALVLRLLANVIVGVAVVARFAIDRWERVTT